jgi:ribosomal protein L17
MLANLSANLFEHKKITTTVTKAKRLRPFAERLITFAKKGDLASRRKVQGIISAKNRTNKTIVHELFTVIGPAMAEREGGYTRITKIGNRHGDNAPRRLRRPLLRLRLPWPRLRLPRPSLPTLRLLRLRLLKPKPLRLRLLRLKPLRLLPQRRRPKRSDFLGLIRLSAEDSSDTIRTTRSDAHHVRRDGSLGLTAATAVSSGSGSPTVLVVLLVAAVVAIVPVPSWGPARSRQASMGQRASGPAGQRVTASVGPVGPGAQSSESAGQRM